MEVAAPGIIFRFLRMIVELYCASDRTRWKRLSKLVAGTSSSRLAFLAKIQDVAFSFLLKNFYLLEVNVTTAGPPPEFSALLKVNPLFANLDEQAVKNIAALCVKQQLAKGEVLFLKGDPGDALYGIRRGEIRIETVAKNGELLTLNVLSSGDLFGEVALLDEQERTASARASEPSELFVLRRSDFYAYLEKDPHIAISVIRLLCKRLRWMSERMEETVFLPLSSRLARRLVALSIDFGAELTITQEELSNFVGAARESVSRQLQEWRRAGIIEIGRGRLRILNVAGLNAAEKEKC